MIKLLLLDEPLRLEVPDFRQLIEELIQTIRRYNVPFDSTKESFQLVKPIIKHGFADTGVVQALFQNANQHTLNSVMDQVIERLELAAAL